MQPAPIPANEEARQRAVNSLNILDTPNEARFDSITNAAAEALDAPICTISIVDANREWYKSCVGIPVKEGDRAISFCGHTIVSGSILIIKDTLLDDRFKDNPQVTNPPHIRFYAGVTLRDRRTHLPVGAFCVKDTKPRDLNMDELNVLLRYAEQAEQELNNGLPKGTIEYVEGAPVDSPDMLNTIRVWLDQYGQQLGECQ